ncbi:MAG: hypothetical protein IJA17_05905 [Oscillospiraceae bacterium]|nr:hypothetical protein [Oscillospiraceae bacterium]
MNESLIYQLLKIIHHNGNIWELISDGYEFGQVSFFIDSLKENKYIFTAEDGKTKLTDSGIAYIAGFEANNKVEKYSEWILPRREMWHSPISDSYIYVPKK